MNFEKPFVAATLTSALLSGCSGPVPRPEQPSTSASESLAPLTFNASPDTNFTVLNCQSNPHHWAVSIDSTPDQAKLGLDQEETIGVPEDPHAKQLQFIAGVTFRSLGRDRYELITSEDTTSVTVDLSKKALARVIHGEPGYDIALSARLGQDGNAYIALNCLPEFDFNGEEAPAPLQDLLPPQIPVPDTRLA